jgi:hypothetical protein
MGRVLVPDSGPAVEVTPHIEKKRERVCQMAEEFNGPELIIQIDIERE